MEKRWTVLDYDREIVSELSAEANVPPIMAKILATRGLVNSEAVSAFLNPQLSDLHDPSTLPDIAKAAEISVSETRRVLKISRQPISLDRPVGESDDSYFGDFIEDESSESPVTAASHGMLKHKLEEVLKSLTYREREIVKLRFGLGDGYTYTLEEVGRIFRVTRERVRQIEAKAIRKLQHPIRSRRLEGFLDGLVQAPQ